MIKIYLATANISRFYLLPITPPAYSVACAREVRTYSTVYNGDINFIRPPGAEEVSFESFLPGAYNRVSLNNDKYGQDAVAEILTYYRSADPIRLIISGGGINMLGTIKEFKWEPGKGNRIDYRLLFAEKKGE